ncbi:MAG: hypothetical protein NZT61_03830 [Deltaproteobacteria bacterium]|nr:hypothetical protein [Deltaproteobacteria bacterium]
MSKVLSEESWKIAEKFIELLDPKPTTIISVLKLLCADGLKICSRTSLSAVERLRGSETFKTSFAAFEETYQQILAGKNSLSWQNLRAVDVAGIILAVYAYGKIKSLIKAEDLAYILPRLSLEIDLGFAISLGLPGLDCLSGAITSIGRFFALALIYTQDTKWFTEYRRILRSMRFQSDHNYEVEKFGCTLEQIFSACSLALGISSERLEGYVTSATFSLDQAPSTHSEYRFWISRRWNFSYIETRKIPSMEHKLDYYPPTELVEPFVKTLETIADNHQGFSLWLEKGDQNN